MMSSLRTPYIDLAIDCLPARARGVSQRLVDSVLVPLGVLVIRVHSGVTSLVIAKQLQETVKVERKDVDHKEGIARTCPGVLSTLSPNSTALIRYQPLNALAGIQQEPPHSLFLHILPSQYSPIQKVPAPRYRDEKERWG